MGQNRPYDRNFFITNGNVKTSGGANQLAKGQLAVVDMFTSGTDGPVIMNTMLGQPKNKKNIAIQVGIPPTTVTRSHSNKNMSTPPFQLSEVTGLRVEVPHRTEQQMEEKIIGYDGFDDSKSFNFKTGQKYFNLSLMVKGGAIQYRGGDTEMEIININVEIPDCDYTDSCADCDACAPIDCQAITLEAIKRLKEYQVQGGTPLAEFFTSITPVFGDCDTASTAVLIPYTHYTLQLCDTGDAEALAYVQAQYNATVNRVSRLGSQSVYEILLPTSAGAPANYSQSIPSLLKGCETCPAGYTATDGGYLYSVTIVDNGVDRSAVIAAALANAKYVTGTVQRGEGNDAGVGQYILVYSSPITSAEIATFVGTSTNARNTATVDLVGDVQAFCTDSTPSTTAWVTGEVCNATSETYSIVLRDNSCGETRLEELQGAYSDLTIAVASSLVNSQRTITLTGTSGTANINIDGVDYLTTFATDLTTTADKFVTAHAAALLVAGYEVTAALGVLTFIGLTADMTTMTITNATTNLAGTLGTVSATPDRKNCSTRYQTTVVSNMVCAECSDVFLDSYVTAAPDSFGTTQWKKDAGQTINPSGNCLCGIRFVGKSFLLSAEDSLSDIVNFVETGTEFEVSAGYPNEIREGIGFIPKGEVEVTPIARFVARPNLYGNLRDMENEGNVYFQGKNRRGNPLSRVLLGDLPAVQDNLAQAIVYYLDVDHNNFTQGFAGKHTGSNSYAFFVEVGKHSAVESLLNDIASAAGHSIVQA